MSVTKPEKKPSNDQDNANSLLDMSQSKVKKMMAQAKARGYITYDELNEFMDPEQVSSEQIEDVMAMLSEMGINVIENDEVTDETEESKETEVNGDTGTSRELVTAQGGTENLDRNR